MEDNHSWEDNTEIYIEIYSSRVRTGFVWLRTRFCYVLKAGNFLCS
jgi:hypothetical protein